jgi:beta-glucanase (GH16 family)
MFRRDVACREAMRMLVRSVPALAAVACLLAPATAQAVRRDSDRDGLTNASPASGAWTVAAEPAPPLPPPASPSEPGPISGQGYNKVWADEFDALSGSAWGQGIWYDPGAPPNSIFVQGGLLNLVSRRSDGYPNITLSTEGGGNPATFRQGYFEARMKWTKGNGAWPAFWLLSYRHATNPSWPSVNPICSQLGEPVSHCYAAELDVFEGQGREPNVFYGTIHRNSCGCYGVSNQQNSNNWTNTGIDLTAGFHTYGMLWTPTQVSWYLDGQLLNTASVYDSTDQPMFLLLQMWIGGWTGGTDSSTPDALTTQVDWVRVWQK